MLKASNPAGLNVPWAWTRREIARAWGCRPWEVDAAPIDEVLTEIRLINLERKYPRRYRG